ncbi:MAG: transcriptional regulator [Microbacterium sp. 69-10]|uniref:helix-turn-helix domain-containing protein n=1 Tax=Microbacterium sp. 69-10 TaxID=1895783 RepID=UPI00095F17A6|nr:helix-turn-helix transcriptional regulator [Microbacterium sp. 69-10]OJU40612.1 MAG: transcriptional regulator [Microbacterium sp. 69-10]
MERRARLRTPADIGLALQQSRIASGMTQTELAAELDIPQSTVSEIESGKATIHVRRILDMARASGLELSATWTEDHATRG